MKYLPLIALLLAAPVQAASPESCVEMFHSQLLLLEAGALEAADKVEDRIVVHCLPQFYEAENNAELEA